MNFLRELEKKKLKASEVWNEDDEFYFNSKDIKRLWRSFCLERKKEIEKEIEETGDDEGDKGYFTAKLVGNLESLEKELSWINQQLKEVK